MVKRIRGVSFSTRVSSQIERDIIYAACGIFNRFIPDVHIFTDHRPGPSGGSMFPLLFKVNIIA
jgi:RNA 3'-terminal phosphate cyclase-like protein